MKYSLKLKKLPSLLGYILWKPSNTEQIMEKLNNFQIVYVGHTNLCKLCTTDHIMAHGTCGILKLGISQRPHSPIAEPGLPGGLFFFGGGGSTPRPKYYPVFMQIMIFKRVLPPPMYPIPPPPQKKAKTSRKPWELPLEALGNDQLCLERQPYWGQASSCKQSWCGRHGLSNILKLQATFLYSPTSR